MPACPSDTPAGAAALAAATAREGAPSGGDEKLGRSRQLFFGDASDDGGGSGGERG